MSRLNQTVYSDFPLRLGSKGVATTDRMKHVRHQIEQVLFTDPGERWFRPDFGAGVRALVFEPNGSALWQITRQRLQSSLADALSGEVAPRDLEVEASAAPDRPERLLITIHYRLTAINHTESLTFEVTR
ncbi:MAG: GPW/gp25 family protein [Saccharospirillum sp.]